MLLVRTEDAEGVTALNVTADLMLEIGRPRGAMWEVALWADILTVEGREGMPAAASPLCINRFRSAGAPRYGWDQGRAAPVARISAAQMTVSARM